jgi:hypothetical protein
MKKPYPFFYMVLATNIGIMVALGFGYYMGKPLANIALTGLVFFVISNLLLSIKYRQDRTA